MTQNKSRSYNRNLKIIGAVLLAIVIIVFIFLVINPDLSPTDPNAFDPLNPVSYCKHEPEYQDDFGAYDLSFTEANIFETSEAIIYAEITDQKWIQVLQGDSEYDYYFEYRTIFTMEIIECFYGDLKPGDSITVMLPTAVSKRPNNNWQETGDMAQELAKGSKLYTLLFEYGQSTYLDYNNYVPVSDYAQYGITRGEQYIFPEVKEGILCSEKMGALARQSQEKFNDVVLIRDRSKVDDYMKMMVSQFCADDTTQAATN